MSKRILVVDDEARIREVLDYALKKEGYDVVAVTDGRQAIDTVEKGGIDLVILDVMLPEVDGLSACRNIRATSRVPILFLSARSDEIDRVLGLELGGDDYLTKPFSVRELVARVKAMFRRLEGPEENVRKVLTRGNVELDVERHEARVNGTLIPLTATEFSMLGALLERPGIVLSRNQLMNRAYKFDNFITERTIDTHIRRIRAKFRTAGGEDPILTVHGVGYKFNET